MYSFCRSNTSIIMAASKGNYDDFPFSGTTAAQTHRVAVVGAGVRYVRFYLNFSNFTFCHFYQLNGWMGFACQFVGYFICLFLSFLGFIYALFTVSFCAD